jgi:hypothetical protein
MVSEWSVDEDSEFSNLSEGQADELKKHRKSKKRSSPRRKKHSDSLGSLSSIRYFLKEAENALTKRFELMEDRKRKQLNAIKKTDRGIQELKK